jgi:hypothetical protein
MYRQAHMHARACETYARSVQPRVVQRLAHGLAQVSLSSVALRGMVCADPAKSAPLRPPSACAVRGSTTPLLLSSFGRVRGDRAARATSAQTANATPRVRSRATHLEQPLLLLAAHFLESCLRSKSAALRLQYRKPPRARGDHAQSSRAFFYSAPCTTDDLPLAARAPAALRRRLDQVQ